MQVPFFKPHISDDEVAQVVNTLRSGWLTTGPKTKEFESSFANYIGSNQAVALNSCTAALHLALEAIGLKSGEGVLVPTMTFAATAEVVRYFNAIPILVDCRSTDLTMDPEDAAQRLKAAQTRGTKVSAMIPMHYGGQICEMLPLLRLAAENDLRVIEDAAHCLPGKFRATPEAPWQNVGSFSDVSCFSFYANKCITTGEGGMACTNNEAYAERMRIMSLHGISRDAWKRFSAEGSWYYEIQAPGFKYNLTDVASSIGLEQLKKVDFLHRDRRRVAEMYRTFLGNIEELTLPCELPNRVHSWHLFAVRLNTKRIAIDRAAFISRLKEMGIGTSVHWMPLHMHPYYRQAGGYKPEDFPVAAAIYPELISLPIYPDMTPGEVEYVASAVRALVENNLVARHG